MFRVATDFSQAIMNLPVDVPTRSEANERVKAFLLHWRSAGGSASGWWADGAIRYRELRREIAGRRATVGRLIVRDLDAEPGA